MLLLFLLTKREPGALLRAKTQKQAASPSSPVRAQRGKSEQVAASAATAGTQKPEEVTSRGAASRGHRQESFLQVR